MTAPALSIYLQGRNSVSADNLNTFEQTCNDVSDLRNFVGTVGSEVFMRGTASPGDGGQGVFYWNPTGVGPDDNGTTSIVPPAAASGCWTRLTGGGSGTVSSVGLSMPSIFTVTGSPVTGSGTLTASLNTQPANSFLAGPSSGVPATPVFRGIAATDLPLATTSAPGAVQPDGTTITISAGVISSSGGSGAVSSVSGDGATISVSPTTGATVVSLKSQNGLTILGNAGASVAVPSALNQASLSKIVGVFDQVSIASATTTDIGTCQSNNVQITGTTTITGLGSSASINNSLYFVEFTGILTLTYNATSLVLPGAANIKTAAGDFGVFLYAGSGNWACLSYSRATGRPVAPFGQETTIASATTTDLGSLTSNLVGITGTTTITSLGSSASLSNPIYNVKFTGALLLTYNATSLILPGAGSITTATNDTAVFEYLGSGNWFCREYYLASGEALVASGSGGGTVTSIATNNGITGGTITTTGTIGLATIGNGTILANYSGSTGIPTATSLQSILGTAIGTDTGSLLAYSGSAWSELLPGSTSGSILTSNGTGVVPTYQTSINISGTITGSGLVATTTGSVAGLTAASGNTNGQFSSLNLRNINAGSSAYTAVNLGNDQNATDAQILLGSSTNNGSAGNRGLAIYSRAGNVVLGYGFSNDFTINSSHTGVFAAAVTVGTTLGITGATTGAAATFSGLVTCSLGSGTGLSVAANAAVNGTLGIGGLTSGAAATFTGLVTCSLGSGTGLSVAANAAVNGTLGVGGQLNGASAVFTGSVTADSAVQGFAYGGTSTGNAFLVGSSSTGTTILLADTGAVFTTGIDLRGATLTNGIILPNASSSTWENAAANGTLGVVIDASNQLLLGTGSPTIAANIVTYAQAGGGVWPATNNQQVIGKSGAAWASGYITGGVWTGSDERLKHGITDSDLGLEFVTKVRPISYYWDDPLMGKGRRYGFSAQQIEQVLGKREFGGLERPANDGDHYNLIYPEMIAPLYKAVQELSVKIERIAA